MSSSISPSKPSNRPGRTAVSLLIAAAASWIVAVFYTLHFHPQLRFLTAICRAKLSWSDELRSEFTSQVIICGGSSSLFSVDPAWALEKHRRPLSNLAISADMGALTLLRFALSKAQSNDTLIIAFEPSLLGGRIGPPQLGVQFAFAMRHPEWAQPDLDFEKQKIPWTSAISALRPGGRHFFTLLAKIAARRPLERYAREPILKTGQAQTSTPLQPIYTAFPPQISSDGRRLLEALSQHCRDRSIKLAYLLPWQYAPSEVTPRLIEANRVFLDQMREIVPVLEEPQVGVITNRAAMADTIWHLNREAARPRTDALLEALAEFEAKR